MAIVIKGMAKPATPPEPTPEPVPVPVPAPALPEVLTAALNLSSGVQEKEGVAPWDVPTDYTILDALKELGTTPKRGKALWLVHKENPAVKYLVRSWDNSNSRAVLEGHKKSQLKPVLTERESALYYPVWV